jgi:hypothetical protein
MLEVMNKMYVPGAVINAQKSGTIIRKPKKPGPGGPEDYRQLTLLNADYKLLARITEDRLGPWMSHLL